MSFFETFGATFMAVLTAQIMTWIAQRWVIKHLDKSADKLEIIIRGKKE